MIYHCFSRLRGHVGRNPRSLIVLFACLIGMLENTQIRHHRCLFWLAFCAPRALFPLMCNTDGQSGSSNVCGRQRWTPSRTTKSHVAAAFALALARTCGLRGVQKRASYEILRMPTFGQKVVAATAAPVEAEKDSHADTGLDELSRADLLRLLYAREQLGLEWAEVAGEAPTNFVCPRGTQTQIMPKRGDNKSTSSGNNDGRRCYASANVDRMYARWAKIVHTTGLYTEGMVDPLMGLKKLMKIRWMDDEGFCKECVAARTDAWDKLRRKLWDDLDVWLQLSTDENA